MTLKTGSSQAFVRDLDPELFHWHGTRVTFMSLQLLKGFWKKKEEKVSRLFRWNLLVHLMGMSLLSLHDSR